MNKKLAQVVAEEMKKKSYYDDEKEKNTLNQSEREGVAEILGYRTQNFGNEEEFEKYKVVRDSLSQAELQQLDNVSTYTFEDEQVYPSVTKKLLKEDIPLLKKVYNLLDSNNLLDGNWDAMSGFEKICLYI